VLSTAKISPGEGSCLIPDHTIIFVAFDTEEPGSFGSIQVLVLVTVLGPMLSIFTNIISWHKECIYISVDLP
jgi:hypothetical protein